METTILWAWVGFALAAYSVIANDSVQTLGTFIASNSTKFRWQTLWLSASAVLIATVMYGWYTHGGDISYGRLNSIPFQEIQWYHAAAPAILLLLTWRGIPVSTSFLVLSTFASTVVLEKMLMKSVLGYGLSAFIAYVLWLGIARLLDEKHDPVLDNHKTQWRTMQWISTGFLWFTWLSHDIANIAVYLPRELSIVHLAVVCVTFVSLLGYIFWSHGGRIQHIVLDKTGTRYVRSATIIDLVYGLILLFFKEFNDIPMSTTWVFVGLLSGRELAISTVHHRHKIGNVFPIIGRDFLKMMFGLVVSVAIVMAVHELQK